MDTSRSDIDRVSVCYTTAGVHVIVYRDMSRRPVSSSTLKIYRRVTSASLRRISQVMNKRMVLRVQLKPDGMVISWDQGIEYQSLVELIQLNHLEVNLTHAL